MAVQRTVVRNNLLLAAASLVIVLAGLKAAQVVLLPVAFAAFIAVLVAPAVAGLQARGVPRAVGVTLVVLGVLSTLLGVGTVLVGSTQRFVAAAPGFQAQLAERFAGVLLRLDAVGLPVSRRELGEMVSPTAAMGLFARTLGELASVVSSTFLMTLALVFILLEATVLPKKLDAVLGPAAAGLDRFARIASDVKVYLAVKTVTSVSTGLLIGLSMALVGLEFPLLWGVTAFLFNFVPTIGSIVAAIPAVLLGIVQLDVGGGLIVLGIYLAVNTAIGSLIEPRVLGARLGLSTLVVFLSLLFWGWLWGPGGALLSVPLTMVAKISLQHSERWSWVSLLLAERPPGMPSNSTPPAAPDKDY